MAQGHRRGVGCYLLTGLCLLVLLRTCTSLVQASSGEEPLAWDDLMEEVEEMLWDKRHCGVEHALCSHNGTTRLVNESSPVFVGGLCRCVSLAMFTCFVKPEPGLCFDFSVTVIPAK